jgi:hypothetical protein
MASNQAKPIQVNPGRKLYDKITTSAEKLRTSRGGFCELALEFILPKIESGELIVINGKIVDPQEALVPK